MFSMRRSRRAEFGSPPCFLGQLCVYAVLLFGHAIRGGGGRAGGGAGRTARTRNAAKGSDKCTRGNGMPRLKRRSRPDWCMQRRRRCYGCLDSDCGATRNTKNATFTTSPPVSLSLSLSPGRLACGCAQACCHSSLFWFRFPLALSSFSPSFPGVLPFCLLQLPSSILPPPPPSTLLRACSRTSSDARAAESKQRPKSDWKKTHK